MIRPVHELFFFFWESSVHELVYIQTVSRFKVQRKKTSDATKGHIIWRGNVIIQLETEILLKPDVWNLFLQHLGAQENLVQRKIQVFFRR